MFFFCITFVKWFTIILLIGNIFNVIANEGLMLNDFQKKLWILRRIDDIVSGLLIVLVWYYVLFPLVLHYVLLLLDQ